MSFRTAEANKAIAEKWAAERLLVSEGKGTRDWTQQQQKDILEKGKAYDEYGFAFQGQHMKSVGAYPEYQGDSGNIQFLTKEEHLEAHGGSWQNPTNWYYDWVTKERLDFGEGIYVPCQAINLSSPIIVIESQSINDEVIERKQELEDRDNRQFSTEDKTSECFVTDDTDTTIYEQEPDFFDRLTLKLNKAKEAVKAFRKNHPILMDVAKGVGVLAVSVAAGTVASVLGGSSTKSVNNSASNDDGFIDEFEAEDDNDRKYPDERSSPREHDVSGYERTQHGKTVYVRPYKRGGKKD